MATLKELRCAAAVDLDQPLVAGDVPTSGVYWTRDQLNGWINEGYEQIYAALVEAEAPWLEVETDDASPVVYPANSRSIDLPALLGVAYDPLKLTGVWDLTGGTPSATLGRQLPFVPYQQFESNRTLANRLPVVLGNDYSGRVCAWWGHAPMRLGVFPYPINPLKLRVRWVPALPSVQNGAVVTRAASLAADGDIPCSIPAFGHRTLAKYAVVRAKCKEESDTRQAQGVLIELKQQLLVSADERQNQNPRSVVVTDPTDYDSGGAGWPPWRW